MKITMLGTTRSGKTTYLSSLLGTLYDGAVDGFRIEPNNTRREEVNQEIEKIGVLYRNGRWPDGTADDNVRNLSMSLYKNQEKLVDFDFIDYRGGALADISVDGNCEKTQELSMALMASDVCLVFIDSIILSKCRSDQTAREHLGVRPITSVLSNAKNRLSASRKKIKIIFVLTKIDAVPENEVPALKQRVSVLYSNVFSLFENEASDFKIFDISAVGRNAVRTTAEWVENNEGNHYIQVKNEIITKDLDFKPHNIASILSQAFIEGINNVEYDVVKLETSLNDMKSSFSRWQQLLDRLFHKSSRRYEIFSLEQELTKSKNQLKDLSKYQYDLKKIISEER